MNDSFFSFVKLITGTFEVFGMLFLGICLMRIPFRIYLKELILISFITSVTQVIAYDIIHSAASINEFVGIVFMTILTKYLFKVTYWYGFLISVTGYISSILVLAGIYTAFKIVGNTFSIHDIIFNPFIVAIDQCIIMLSLVRVGLLLYTRGIGFWFMTEELSFKPSVRSVNTFLVVSIVFSILSLETTIYLAAREFNYVNLLVAVTVIAIPVVFVTTYLSSIKQLKIFYKDRQKKICSSLKDRSV
ncbi:hypothetical protein [Priestia megaterium]|uniref:Uncharacterized protein n=1 Tax=Priestia megaterium TaxID=1404 RepID=A0A6M6E8F9_PRIMG|nr:hypothetical protein [Priestia megaterium]QJX80708.1 hypothetical protein FDZ14_31965 [Priestia megaterium]